MVTENVKQAVVGGCGVAGDAGGYGLSSKGVGGAACFSGADHEVIEIGVGIDGAETNLAPAKDGRIAVLGLEGDIDIQFGGVVVEQDFDIVLLVGVHVAHLSTNRFSQINYTGNPMVSTNLLVFPGKQSCLDF